jgi:hypothetical protein
MVAVVNGTLVKVGQSIDGAAVVAISSKGVVLEIEGKQYQIPVPVAVSGKAEP